MGAAAPLGQRREDVSLCPCDSDGCTRQHAHTPIPSLPADALEAPSEWEEGEPEAATENLNRDLSAGEAGKWSE